MSDFDPSRPRIRRPEPERTEPIRNARGHRPPRAQDPYQAAQQAVDMGYQILQQNLRQNQSRGGFPGGFPPIPPDPTPPFPPPFPPTPFPPVPPPNPGWLEMLRESICALLKLLDPCRNRGSIGWPPAPAGGWAPFQSSYPDPYAAPSQNPYGSHGGYGSPGDPGEAESYPDAYADSYSEYNPEAYPDADPAPYSSSEPSSWREPTTVLPTLVQIQTSRPVRTTLEFQGTPAGRVLAVDGLVSESEGGETLEVVRVVLPEAQEAPLELQVEIPESIASGNYCAVLYDPEAGEEMGLLRVEVLPA